MFLGGGGAPQPNTEGASAGRTGLGEAVRRNELLRSEKERNSGVDELICAIEIVASLKRRERRLIKGAEREAPAQLKTGESGDAVVGDPC